MGRRGAKGGKAVRAETGTGEAGEAGAGWSQPEAELGPGRRNQRTAAPREPSVTAPIRRGPAPR